ncbi:MAG: PIN domain-containing protein [Bryobacteraceae bacterium]
MVLVDTSVWVSHLRSGEPRLTEFLEKGLVLMHPAVIGELACGNLRNRRAFLSHLAELQEAASATNEEALLLIEGRKLWGRGVGWIDAHLLASSLLSDCLFWTLDERLMSVCDIAGVKVHPASPRRPS